MSDNFLLAYDSGKAELTTGNGEYVLSMFSWLPPSLSFLMNFSLGMNM